MLYSPKAAQNGLALQPERGNSYPSLAAVLPLGGGVTLRTGSRLAFTAEALYFFTTSDTLDDVSQRGNPKSTDNFGTLTVRVEVSLHKGRGKRLIHDD